MCFDSKMTLFWQNLLKAVCFGQNGFFLRIAGKKQSFLPKYLDLQGPRHGDFQVFGSKWPKIRTTYLCRTQNTYGTLKGRYQVNL